MALVIDIPPHTETNRTARGWRVKTEMPSIWKALVRRLDNPSETMAGIAHTLAQRLAGRFRRIARTRHKTAERFNVNPTGILHFEGDPPRSRGGGAIDTRSTKNTVSLVVTGVPFLARAFGQVTITPRQAHALTIPINRQSVHHTAGELEMQGWDLFSHGGILYGRRKGSNRTYRLYALVKRVVQKQDRGLLPTDSQLKDWAGDAFLDELDKAGVS